MAGLVSAIYGGYFEGGGGIAQTMDLCVKPI